MKKLSFEENGYWRIDVPEGMTLNKAIEMCKNKFRVWSFYDDFDKSITENDRDTKKAYSVWIKANVEADENLKNRSSQDLNKEGIKGITLLERLLLELQYYKETGEHLDIDKATLCNGSRDVDGGVPDCSWCNVGFTVHYYYPGHRYEGLRARQVFLTNPCNSSLSSSQKRDSHGRYCREESIKDPEATLTTNTTEDTKAKVIEFSTVSWKIEEPTEVYRKYSIPLEKGKIFTKISKGEITLSNEHGYTDFRFIKSKPEKLEAIIKGMQEVLRLEKELW